MNHKAGCYLNKSDISYLKTSRAFDVLIHSSQTLLVSDSVGTTGSYSLLALLLSGQPRVVSSTLPLLLGIHLEVVTVVDYS